MSRAQRARLASIIATAMVAGCAFSPDVPNGHIICQGASECPSGYTCEPVPGMAVSYSVCCKERGCATSIIPPSVVDAAGSPSPAGDGQDASVEIGMASDGQALEVPLDLREDVPLTGSPDGAEDADLAWFDSDGLDAVLSDAPTDGFEASPEWLVDAPMLDGGSATMDLAPPDAALKVRGEPCQEGNECASGFCADGVCCDGSCAGQCQSCAELGKLGMCTTVTGAPRGERLACAAMSAACAGRCAGLPDRCSYPGSERSCAAAVCLNDTTVKPASVCNGAGECPDANAGPCPSGQYCSGDACKAMKQDGIACQGNVQCGSGNCSNGLCCATGYGSCGGGGSCITLSTNDNCGRCGNACSTGYHCSGGSCLINCYTVYADADGDGYGDPKGMQTQCGSSIPPAGYVTNKRDCCDLDPNAKPGQTQWFTTANLCGSFDYDCSGSAQLAYPRVYDCALVNSDCQGSGWANSVPACGQAGPFIWCEMGPAMAPPEYQTCQVNGASAGQSQTQSCR